MKRMALSQNLLAEIWSLRHKWTNTDYKACRTCGVLLVLLAVTIVLPPIIADVATGGRILHGILIDREERVTGTFSLGRYRSTYLLMLIGLFLAGGILAFSGAIKLKLAKTFRNDLASSTCVREQCGHLLLWLLISPVCIVLVPLTWGCLIVLFFMEGYFIIPHAFAVFFLWCVSLFFAFGMLSPQQEIADLENES